MAQLLVLFVTAFVDMVGLAMIVPLLPFYATEFGASATIIGVLVSAFSIAQLLVAPVWGRFSDRYGRRGGRSDPRAGAPRGGTRRGG